MSNCECWCQSCNTDANADANTADVQYSPEATVYLVPQEGEYVAYGWELPEVACWPSIGEWVQHPEDDTLWVVRGVLHDPEFSSARIYVEGQSWVLDHAGHPLWGDAPVEAPAEQVIIKVKNLNIK